MFDHVAEEVRGEGNHGREGGKEGKWEWDGFVFCTQLHLTAALRSWK